MCLCVCVCVYIYIYNCLKSNTLDNMVAMSMLGTRSVDHVVAPFSCYLWESVELECEEHSSCSLVGPTENGVEIPVKYNRAPPLHINIADLLS